MISKGARDKTTIKQHLNPFPGGDSLLLRALLGVPASDLERSARVAVCEDASGKYAMPLLQYFSVVGAALVAMLWLADANLPRAVERQEPERTYKIRIVSERKSPEAVTFSGHPINYGSAPALRVVDLSVPLEVAPKPSRAAESLPSTPNVNRAKPRKKVAQRKQQPTERATRDAFARMHAPSFGRETLTQTHHGRPLFEPMF